MLQTFQEDSKELLQTCGKWASLLYLRKIGNVYILNIFIYDINIYM